MLTDAKSFRGEDDATVLQGTSLVRAQWTGQLFFDLHAIDSWNELIKLRRVLLKSRDIVVADHEHLKPEGTACVVDYLDQAGN